MVAAFGSTELLFFSLENLACFLFALLHTRFLFVQNLFSKVKTLFFFAALRDGAQQRGLPPHRLPRAQPEPLQGEVIMLRSMKEERRKQDVLHFLISLSLYFGK